MCVEKYTNLEIIAFVGNIVKADNLAAANLCLHTHFFLL